MIKNPETKMVKKGNKKVEVTEDISCHVKDCGRPTHYVCDFCGKRTCMEHQAGAVYRGNPNGKWGPHDICKRCFHGLYGKPVPVTYSYEYKGKIAKVTDMVPERLVVK